MASKYGGYMGPYLDINLSTGRIGTYKVSDEDRERFLGNKGLAAKILYDNLEPGINPLSEENILIFNTGPLNGSGAPSTSRFNVTSKSVMTGGIAHSNCGGNFGIFLKKAGYDGLIVRGKADKPVYITISDKEVQINDAASLWGKNTEETQHELVKDYGKKISTAVIGPAGENLVRYACIASEERMAGRTGVGAVMGSKNLKAIVASGNKKIPIHDPEGFKEAMRKWVETLKSNQITGETLKNYGTANLVNLTNATHTLPTKNFNDGTWEEGQKISGEAMTEIDFIKNSGCRTCPMRCERRVRVDGKDVKGPEFETVGLWGSNILNNDLKKIYKWNYLLDLYGMDTMSAGATVAFAMELNEKGLWKNGLEFGKFEDMNQIIEDIAYRRGIGNELAEGVMRLSEKYGGKEFAMHSKGLELASYEPRRSVGHGLGYATAPRGGCHLEGGYMVFFENVGPLTIDPLTPKLKPAFTMFNQNAMDAISCAGNCVFTSYAVVPDLVRKFIPPSGLAAKIVNHTLIASRFLMNLQGKLEGWMLPFHLPLIPHTKVLAKLTGMKINLGDFLLVGERTHLMQRAFNLREGFTKADDDLPDRMKQPQKTDIPESFVNLEEMLPVYYKVRGLDELGFPKSTTLTKLNMEFLQTDMELIKNDNSRYTTQRHNIRKTEEKVLNQILKARSQGNGKKATKSSQSESKTSSKS